MRDYIQRNTELRMQTKRDGDKFSDDLFKLMNNSIFGKTCENIRNHKDIKLENRNEQQVKLLSDLLLKSSRMFDNEILGVEKNKEC
jgi:hypothetical protein